MNWWSRLTKPNPGEYPPEVAHFRKEVPAGTVIWGPEEQQQIARGIPKIPDSPTTRHCIDDHVQRVAPSEVTWIEPKPVLKGKSLRERVTMLLFAQPERVWTFSELWGAVGGPEVVQATYLRSTITALKVQGLAESAGHGFFKAWAVKADAPLMSDAIGKTASKRTHDILRAHEERDAPTPQQHDGYLRNLVARLTVAVAIDLGIGEFEQDKYERLGRWLEHAFSMGVREATGKDTTTGNSPPSLVPTGRFVFGEGAAQ